MPEGPEQLVLDAGQRQRRRHHEGRGPRGPGRQEGVGSGTDRAAARGPHGRRDQGLSVPGCASQTAWLRLSSCLVAPL